MTTRASRENVQPEKPAQIWAIRRRGYLGMGQGEIVALDIALTPLDTISGVTPILIPLTLALSSAGTAAGDGSVTPPTEIQLSPPGWVQTETKGRYLMDAQARRAVVDAVGRLGRDLVIDYHHQSLTSDVAPAAGWITALDDRGDGPKGGLWARVNWTDRAASYLQQREFRYLSPVLLVGKADRRPQTIHSVALTNVPEIHGALALVASADHIHNEEDQMRERLVMILKLAADVTDEALIASVQALAERPAIAPELREALQLSAQATPSEAVATIHALQQGHTLTVETTRQVTALQIEVKTLRDQAAVRSRDELVATALSQGKITPAQREWAEGYALRDAEGFKTFVDKSPVIVPVGGAMTLPLSQPAGAGGIDESQRTINRALGISDEQFRKHTTEGGR